MGLEDEKFMVGRLGSMAKFKVGSYGNGRLAIQLVAPDEEPLAVLTVNLPDEALAPGEFFIKAWSENELVIDEVKATNRFIDTGRRVPTGFVEAEVWRFARHTDEARYAAGLGMDPGEMRNAQ